MWPPEGAVVLTMMNGGQRRSEMVHEQYGLYSKELMLTKQEQIMPGMQQNIGSSKTRNWKNQPCNTMQQFFYSLLSSK